MSNYRAKSIRKEQYLKWYNWWESATEIEGYKFKPTWDKFLADRVNEWFS